MSEPKPLSYATYDADGTPDFVPEAEALIDAREPLRRLRPLFRRASDAAKYLAKSLRRRKSLENLPAACEHCGRDSGGIYMPLEWGIKVPHRFFEFTFSVTTKTHDATAVTHHPICQDCLNAWGRRFRWIRRGQWVYNVAYWLMLAVLLLSDTKLVSSFLPRRKSFPWWWYLGFGLVGVTGLLMRRIWMLALPGGIRRSVPRGLVVTAYHPPASRRSVPVIALPVAPA